MVRTGRQDVHKEILFPFFPSPSLRLFSLFYRGVMGLSPRVSVRCAA